MSDVTPEKRRDASVVVERLVAAMNEHDLGRMIALFHPAYESRQPAHPGRAFTGREQVRANWAAMSGGVPGVRAEVVRTVQDGELNWSESRRTHHRGNALRGGDRARSGGNRRRSRGYAGRPS